MLRFTRHPTGQLNSSWYNGTLQVYPGYQGDAMCYYVSNINGNDGNNGLSWERPFATIQAGLDRARYVAGTAVVDNIVDHHSFVFVAPGVYNEELLWEGYNIHLIGCGGLPGAAYGPVINQDGAGGVATSTFSFSGSGNEIANFHINMATAFAAVLCTAGNNNWIHDNVIRMDGTNATNGIHMMDCMDTVIENNVIDLPTVYGIYIDGGAGQDFSGSTIRGNHIHGETAGVIGIQVDADVATCVNSVITDNHIDVVGGGAGARGIVNAFAGPLLVTRNMIVVGAGATLATHAGTGMLHNCGSINGVVTVELDDD